MPLYRAMILLAGAALTWSCSDAADDEPQPEPTATPRVISWSREAKATPTPPPEHVVHFPEEKSLGTLYIYNWGLRTGWTSGKAVLGEARGTVRVPAGKELWLWMDDESVSDFSPLADLNPDDLQYLRVNSNFGDGDIAYVTGLTALRSLEIHSTRVTHKGLEKLKEALPIRNIYSDLYFRATPTPTPAPRPRPIS